LGEPMVKHPSLHNVAENIGFNASTVKTKSSCYVHPGIWRQAQTQICIISSIGLALQAIPTFKVGDIDDIV